jgi:hypothetical protein
MSTANDSGNVGLVRDVLARLVLVREHIADGRPYEPLDDWSAIDEVAQIAYDLELDLVRALQEAA